ncbi:hypothetical protein LCGC14_2353190, partial [marine sediment metagenome]
QTTSGERYLSHDYMRNWQQDSQYPDKQIFTFSMFKYFFEPLDILNDTEVLITYYYHKESLSYYAQHDDILYGSDFTFTIRDSLGTIIKNLGNVSSIVGNNITFTDSIRPYLTIGKNFTIEYTFKTRGGLLESKHLFIEVQPHEMIFYNNFYPFSGGSIMAPLYYNLSANYQYQLALNYRLQEKAFLTFSKELKGLDLVNDYVEIDLTSNEPLANSEDTVLTAYFINSTGQREIIEDDYVSYNMVTSMVTINNFEAFTEEDTLEIGDTIFAMIMPQFHNKYQPFHQINADLVNSIFTITNWTVAQDPENNLIANFESNNFIYGANAYESITKGRVKQVYMILNSTNKATYYLTQDLNDATNGWKDYDTLIMKMGFLNPEVLKYLNVSFFYDNVGEETYIGYTNVTLDMFGDDSGAVYIRLPDSPDFQYFTVDNNAHITFSPTFNQHEDYLGFFYEQGLPTFQTVEWNSDNVEDGYLSIDLDKEIISLYETVYVFNDQYEFLYEVNPDVRRQSEDYNGQTYTVEYNNISLPSSYILNDDIMEMKDGDILFLKYNAS